MTDSKETALELQKITRVFQQGDTELQILCGVNLTVKSGEIVALLGPSGSGKSTLLQIAGLLESPTSGSVLMNNISCQTLDDEQRTLLRRQYIGFVYQFHHLLPEFSALENVMLPQFIGGVDRATAKARAEQLLLKMGLSHRLEHRPQKLSGGEQQRVAIARALANKPKILLADEPTGNLDSQTSEKVFNEMLSLVRETGLSAIVATHNLELANKMDRIIRLNDGILS